MKKLISPLIIVLLLYSCSSEPKEEINRKDILEEIALPDLKSNLRDPESLTIHDAIYSTNKNTSSEYFILDYGAKNGFGGMVRDIVVYKFYGNTIIEKMTISDYNDEIKTLDLSLIHI